MTNPPFFPGTRLAAYLRDSGGNEQDLSIERQRNEISAWAAQYGLVISGWYEDAARSGTTTAGRDRFLEMVNTIQPPTAGVVIWEFARLARQYDDITFHIADLRRRGFAVHSIVDNIPNTLEGRLFESFLAYKSAKYSQDLARAVSSGFKRSIEVGHTYPARLPPFGFKKDFSQVGTYRDGRPRLAGRLVHDPESAPSVREIFAARARGATYNEIHHACPVFVHSVSLNRILQNPIYIGTLRFGGQEYPDFCEPIVSVETWDAAQAVNQARSDRFGYNHPRALNSRYTLTGLAFCQRCGAPMYGRTHPGKRIAYYVCRAARVGKHATCRAPFIPQDELEELVLQAVERVALDPARLAPLLQTADATHREHLQDAHARIQRLRASLQETARQIRHIMAAIKDAGHSPSLLAELQQLEKTQADQQARLTKAEADSIALKLDISPGELEQALVVLKKTLRSSPAERVIVLRGIVVSVHAERIGGSPLRHRKGTIVGTVKLRLPLLADENILDVSLGE